VDFALGSILHPVGPPLREVRRWRARRVQIGVLREEPDVYVTHVLGIGHDYFTKGRSTVETRNELALLDAPP
jgi:hypothetical protein